METMSNTGSMGICILNGNNVNTAADAKVKIPSQVLGLILCVDPYTNNLPLHHVLAHS